MVSLKYNSITYHFKANNPGRYDSDPAACRYELQNTSTYYFCTIWPFTPIAAASTCKAPSWNYNIKYSYWNLASIERGSLTFTIYVING